MALGTLRTVGLQRCTCNALYVCACKISYVLYSTCTCRATRSTFEGTKVLSKVRKYESTFESTFVLSYESTFSSLTL
jgi:hypothetical protein